MPRAPQRRHVLAVPRISQPDAVSCGPTCLAQVLCWYGGTPDVAALARRVPRNPDGGTTAVQLARLALALGMRARLYPLGVRVFDPTWWEHDDDALIALLGARAAGLGPGAEQAEVLAWREFLAEGGHIAFHEPSPALLVRILDRGRPIICGLNATWLYREARTQPDTNREDAVHGQSTGHFVTVVGHTGGGLHMHIADPSEDAPFSAGGAPGVPAERGRYPLPTDRLIHAILLGDGTHDAVLLEVWPSPPAHRRSRIQP